MIRSLRCAKRYYLSPRDGQSASRNVVAACANTTNLLNNDAFGNNERAPESGRRCSRAASDASDAAIADMRFALLLRRGVEAGNVEGVTSIRVSDCVRERERENCTRGGSRDIKGRARRTRTAAADLTRHFAGRK